MPSLTSRPVTVLIDVAAWAAIHAGTGYLAHRLPSRFLEQDLPTLRPRAIERDGRLYVDVFGIKRWKRHLPEAGAFFAGGFDKRSLRARDDAYLRLYERETRRAELGHWMAVACAPLFFLWNPWPVGVVMILYAGASNGPCIMAQRYNRFRIRRVLSRRAR